MSLRPVIRGAVEGGIGRTRTLKLLRSNDAHGGWIEEVDLSVDLLGDVVLLREPPLYKPNKKKEK